MRSDRYSLWIVSPPGYLHSRCFEEVADTLQGAFAELGIHAPIVTTPPDGGTVITLGANLLAKSVERVPDNFVLYNLEQISPDSPWCSAEYLQLLSRSRVWDYSPVNVKVLAGLGIDATLCELGHHPRLARIAPAPQDIDVLFVGSLNPRRARVLVALENAGKQVFPAVNVYGVERDQLIARAKLVLNVHFYEARVLEMVRISYLLANRVCVVSERGSDPALAQSYAGGIAFAEYDTLVPTCLALLDAPERRRAIAEHGHELFRARPQAPFLRAALAEERPCRA